MKAIILGAGKGTRVRPLTYSRPKPMIPVLGKPVMETLVELLRAHGVRQILVNTSYLATEIESYFRDGARFGVEMAYSFEGALEAGGLIDRPVGSAGAIRRIQDHSGFFDETFFVLCGDALVDLDLGALADFHRSRGGEATIGLAEVPRDQVSSYGVVVTDSAGRILEFQEKPPVAEARSTTVNTGIYVFEPRIVDRIPSGVSYDIGGQLFPSVVAGGGGLYGLAQPFHWFDIGKVSDYYQVMMAALEGRVPGVSLPGRALAPGIHVGLNVRLDLARSRIEPPVFIGGSSSVEPGATLIGPTYVGPGSVIESGARVERSVIFDYTRIGARADVIGRMVCGGYCVDAAGTVVELAQADIAWAIADARSPKAAPTPDQQRLLDLLRDF
jgi:mannose-1-phosphate guanylyltransferase